MSTFNLPLIPIVITSPISPTGVQLAFADIQYDATLDPTATVSGVISFQNSAGAAPNIKGIFISHFRDCSGQAECIWSFSDPSGSSVTLFCHSTQSGDWTTKGILRVGLIL